MLSSNIKKSCSALLLTIIFCLGTKITAAAEDKGAFGLTNFAFASYLGTGFYTTSGQRVFVIQIPFEHTIIQASDTEAGWILNLPVTLGYIDIDSLDLNNLPDLKNDAATITFLPGIEYLYPVTPDWTLSPFADYGFARDLNYTNNILITGIGMKSSANFQHDKNMFTLGNRFLYAREQSGDTSKDSSYSLIETGLNYRVTSDYSFASGPLYTNLYYINFYYPNKLDFFERTENPIRVGIEHEVGITFSNTSGILFFEKTQLGIGVRFGNNVNVYRIVFGMPF